ncbi:MAG TPA: hypothetical protein VGO40_19775 [Longimicrobium sp.]|jgi:hypothetical protein|nr:hypothetical protein [Longimicrobium sp.]
MRNRLNLSAAVLIPLLLAACVDGKTPTATADHNDEQIRVENECNQRQLEALIAEIDPHVRYAADGSWALAPGAKLSPAAAEFARQAHAASMKALAGRVQLSRSGEPRFTTVANQSGIRFYWWGARVSVPSRATQGIAYAWRTSGAPAAVKTFLSYFGYSGWAVGVAGVLVPAYALTIGYIDRVGGYRGVYMHVPWSIVPTYITPQ